MTLSEQGDPNWAIVRGTPDHDASRGVANQDHWDMARSACPNGYYENYKGDCVRFARNPLTDADRYHLDRSSDYVMTDADRYHLDRSLAWCAGLTDMASGCAPPFCSSILAASCQKTCCEHSVGRGVPKR